MQVTVYDERGRRLVDGVRLKDIVDPVHVREDGSLPVYPGMRVRFNGVWMWIKWVSGYMKDQDGGRFGMIGVSRKRQKVRR